MMSHGYIRVADKISKKAAFGGDSFTLALMFDPGAKLWDKGCPSLAHSNPYHSPLFHTRVELDCTHSLWTP